MKHRRERPDKPVPHSRARFPARLDALAGIGDWLRGACERCGESGAWLDTFELAVIEASSNIIRHGAAATARAAQASHEPVIALTLRRGTRALTLDLFDGGKPVPQGLFDARKALPPFDPEDIDTLPEGGMGLGIMHASVDCVEHRRRLGINRLRLVKNRG
ncbi:ATP-binding protein [Burkholderia sp. Ac-20353]|uniref:ATP-binding protein n=1 Tax=Burkholderia sp. Ac-20353 TaxID=2703894 RepID=UPI00197B2664|nr:ATP-binding protein [Burkholderia sp. Ac-20353]MBN3788585.1 ATP-binding protein [Burkholderia sp. Ac-20353]